MAATPADGVAPRFSELVAPPAWRTVDLISDLHLQAAEPATVDAWCHYLDTTPADALFILGDLFEVWVGDDAADDATGFEARCGELLQRAAQQRPVFFMHGNRDFLIGPTFAARSGFTLLDDPTVLVLRGERWLLTHGDLLCLEDTEYLRFRAMVRSPQWQAEVLARSLSERRALAREVRGESEARKSGPQRVWADVDDDAARQWMVAAGVRSMVHGHTHRPATHDLRDGRQRIVLSDWDAAAQPPRAQVLRLSAAGAQRIDLSPR